VVREVVPANAQQGSKIEKNKNMEINFFILSLAENCLRAQHFGPQGKTSLLAKVYTTIYNKSISS